MPKNVTLERTLFIDIETVSQYGNYEEIPEKAKPLWQQKANWFATKQGVEWSEEFASQVYDEKAGIYSEFGKIVVVSVGFLRRQGEAFSIKLKSFASDNEKEVLQGLSDLLRQHYKNPAKDFICGHNIKEFDVPYICRRLIIHGMPLPEIIDVTGKKPWETGHLVDTMDLWRFGDFKNFTSLNLLAHVLDIPTPKDDIDGSQVGRVYWEEQDLERISVYCEKDVATCARVLLRLLGEPGIPDDNIETVTG